MQKPNKLLSNAVLAAALALVGIGASAQSSPPSVTQDSIITLQQLIKVDNALAREKANAEISQSGLNGPKSDAQPAKSAPQPRAVPAAVTMSVQSIAGVDSDIKADVIIAGQTQKGIRKGSTVKGCLVESIVGKCVTLIPAAVDKGKPLALDQCPSACWTGMSNSIDINTVSGSQQRMPNFNGQSPGPLPTGQFVASPIQTMQPPNR
jgi:hypothetical protein